METTCDSLPGFIGGIGCHAVFTCNDGFVYNLPNGDKSKAVNSKCFADVWNEKEGKWRQMSDSGYDYDLKSCTQG